MVVRPSLDMALRLERWLGVGLEFVVKLPSEAGRARGNAFASGTASGRLDKNRRPPSSAGEAFIV